MNLTMSDLLFENMASFANQATHFLRNADRTAEELLWEATPGPAEEEVCRRRLLL
jgi:hypothetical protein